MTKILYWIDDTHDDQKPPRGATKRKIEEGLDVVLQIHQFGGRSQFDDLLPTIKADATCGVILDYQLTRVGQAGEWAFGNTWAAEIRAKAPSVAIIGISHANPKKIPKLRLKSFLEFYPRDVFLGLKHLRDVSGLLTGHATTFKTFKADTRKRGLELMQKLIDPPKLSREVFEAALPTELISPWDEETPHVAGRWIWHQLLGRPGLLFDELGLATYLGLNLTGLEAIADHFKPALYASVFASETRPRWWMSEVRPIVEKILKGDVVGPVSGMREELLDSLKVAKSKRLGFLAKAHSHRDAGLIPDHVAYRDDEREEKDRVQALADDTCVDPKDDNIPFGFEARRIFKPASRQ